MGGYSGYGRQYYIDTPVTYLYLMGVSFAYWVIGYIYSIGYPVYSEVYATPLWDAICQMMPNKEITYIIGILLMLGGAFLIHRANYILAIVREKTYLPPLLYILFISTNPSFFPLKSTTIGVFCLILAVYQLLSGYHDRKSVLNSFNWSVFIGIGSLVWVHILWFLPLFWVGMFNFKSLGTRTFLSSILGLSTVYWFLFGWCVLQGDFEAFTVPFAAFTKVSLFENVGARLLDLGLIIFIGLIVLIASIRIITHEHEENIRTRQYLFFMISFFVLAFALFFLYESLSDEYFAIACFPASILIAHLFTVRKTKKQYWTFHLLMISFIVLTFFRLWSSL